MYCTLVGRSISNVQAVRIAVAKKCGEKFKGFHIIHQVNKLAYFKDLV